MACVAWGALEHPGDVVPGVSVVESALVHARSSRWHGVGARASWAAVVATILGSCEAPGDGSPIEVVPPASLDAESDSTSTPPIDEPFSPTYDVAALFDLAELADPGTVQVTVKATNVKQLDSGIWQVPFAFRSQVWHASGWDHASIAYLPAAANPQSDGLWALVHASGPDLASDLSPDAAFAREVTTTLGIPVLVIGDLPTPTVFRKVTSPELAEQFPQCFEVYVGDDELRTCSSALTQAGEDLQWDVLLPLTRAYLRAMTAAGVLRDRLAAELPQLAVVEPPTRFALLGAGDRGLAAWLAGAVDARVAGAWVAAHDAANLEAFWATVAISWPDRASEAAEWLVFLDGSFGRHWRTLHDPTAWGERMGDRPLVLAGGTNDPSFPLESGGLYAASLATPAGRIWAPNFGHGYATAPLDVSWRAFVRQVAAGGTPPRLALDVATVEGARVATIEATGLPEGAQCSVWWAQPLPGKGERDLRSSVWTDTPTAASSGDRHSGIIPAGVGSLAAFATCTVAGEPTTEHAVSSAVWLSWTDE